MLIIMGAKTESGTAHIIYWEKLLYRRQDLHCVLGKLESSANCSRKETEPGTAHIIYWEKLPYRRRDQRRAFG